MKAPSQNMAKSLHSHSVPARGDEEVEISNVTNVASSAMTVPGDGGVTEPVGARRIERSAVAYTDPMERYGGAGTKSEG